MTSFLSQVPLSPGRRKRRVAKAIGPAGQAPRPAPTEDGRGPAVEAEIQSAAPRRPGRLAGQFEKFARLLAEAGRPALPGQQEQLARVAPHGRLLRTDPPAPRVPVDQ